MDLTLLREYILRASKHVKRIAYLIAAIGAAASYGTQVELLVKWGMGTPFSQIIPATIDLLAICAAIGMTIPGLPDKDRRYVSLVLIIAVLVSGTANFMGGHNWVTRVGHTWPVVAYLLAEGIANRIRTYQANIEARASVPQHKVETPVHATVTVRKPAAITASKPGSAKSKILELAAASPSLSHDEIAATVGVKPGWVRYVLKNK